MRRGWGWTLLQRARVEDVRGIGDLVDTQLELRVAEEEVHAEPVSEQRGGDVGGGVGQQGELPW